MSTDGLLQTFFEVRPALHRFLLARGASDAEAEDVIQEMSIKVSGEMPGPVAQPRAYLYKMAANQFQLHRRAELRRDRREEDWVDLQSDGSREVDPAASAEQHLIYREQLAIVRAALDRLPERTRWIFTRYRIDGEPQKRIAADLGIGVGAVEKHLTRAYSEIASVRHLLRGDRSLPRHLSEGKVRYER